MPGSSPDSATTPVSWVCGCSGPPPPAGVRAAGGVGGGDTVATRDLATAFVDGPTDDLVVGRRLTMVGRLAPSDTTSEVATIDVVRRSPTRPAAWWWEASERVRAGVRNAVAHTGHDPSALVPALVDGDDQRISDEVREEFRRSGLTHLLAVSGTNLTIVLAVVLVLARSLGVPRRVLVALGDGVRRRLRAAGPTRPERRQGRRDGCGRSRRTRSRQPRRRADALGGDRGPAVHRPVAVALARVRPVGVRDGRDPAGGATARPTSGAMDAALVRARRRRADRRPARLHPGDRGDLRRGVAGRGLRQPAGRSDGGAGDGRRPRRRAPRPGQRPGRPNPGHRRRLVRHA